MRVQVLICVVILLALGITAQETNRREKLRRLIQSARSGDVDARQTLKNIREQVRARSGGSRQNIQAAEPAVEPQPQEPEPQQFSQEPQDAHFQEPEPVRQETHFETPKPVRKPRVHFQSEQNFQSHLEPHRALNRGLEIDTRSELNAVIRVTNETKEPPVETIRRYSYFDEQGNYIFGYEAADGSFKEEKRGRDCIVNGKYGYVDPDGVKREFTYVSGNQCDPDAPADSEVAGEQAPLPLNDQFLVQTQERQLSDADLKELQFNRRRQPVQQTSRIQETSQQQPRQQQQVQRQRPVQKQNLSPIPRREFEENFPTTQAPTTTTTFITTTSAPVAPVEEPHRFAPIQQSPFAPRIQNTFRPTPKPLDINFNFDHEFKNLFNNFGSDRRAPSRPLFEPLPRSRQSTPSQPPATAPPTRATTEAPPTPESPRFPPPTTKTTDSPSRAPAQGQAHQLVFDAVSGSFKTVPLQNLVTVAPINHIPAAPKHTFSPTPASVRSGVPLFPTNPLPPVPIGSLSINRGNNNFAQDFAKFFSNFRI